MSAELLDAALDYKRLRDWAIVPIGRTRDGHEKAVLVRWKKYQAIQPTDADLERGFRMKNVTGLGVVLGPVSGGLACRDFDRAESYHEWAKAHPDLAATLPTVETGRGYHVYFRADVGRIIKYDDGELRGLGGVCALPPSLHPSGKRYRWLVPLPDGELPAIDPSACGLAAPPGADHLQRDRETERQRGGSHDVGAVVNGSTDCGPAGAESVGHSDANGAPLSNNPHHGFGVSDSSVSSVSLLTGPDAERIEAAIVATVPNRVGTRNGLTFALARELQAIPSAAKATFAELRPVVARWFELARPFIATPDFDTTWSDFVNGWPKVKYPTGSGPLAVALAAADAADPPTCATRFESIETRRIIGLCRELQRNAGDGVFYLACRTLERLIGMDHTLASKRLGMLVAEGILDCVERGRPGRASRYRYIGGD